MQYYCLQRSGSPKVKVIGSSLLGWVGLVHPHVSAFNHIIVYFNDLGCGV